MLRLTAERGSPSKVRPASASAAPSKEGIAHNSTKRSESSATASRKAPRTTFTTAALGLFMAILAVAGYAAEHTPTPLAALFFLAAFRIVFVRLFSDGGAS